MLLTFGNAGSDEFNFSHLTKLTTTKSEEGTAKHLEKKTSVIFASSLKGY